MMELKTTTRSEQDSQNRDSSDNTSITSFLISDNSTLPESMPKIGRRLVSTAISLLASIITLFTAKRSVAARYCSCACSRRTAWYIR